MEANQDIEKKQFEVLIPRTTINPGPHRALIISVALPDGIETSSGLIIPTNNLVKDQNKNNVRIESRRYFVVKAAKDFCVDSKQPDIELEEGDEVYPLIWDGVTPINLPAITDWDNQGIQMNVIHDSEIFGWKKRDPKRFSEVKFCACVIPDYEYNGPSNRWICKKCGGERMSAKV